MILANVMGSLAKFKPPALVFHPKRGDNIRRDRRIPIPALGAGGSRIGGPIMRELQGGAGRTTGCGIFIREDW